MKRSPDIELRHLRYFLAAAEHGSFRKAGLSLGIQESAVSRRIRDLEDRLGAALFNRRSSGVCLTFAGSRFLGRAQPIVRAVDEGAKDVAAIGRSEDGTVRIGIYSSIASGFLIELLRDYCRHQRNVRIDLIDGNASEHVADLRQFRLDVAFLMGTNSWADCEREHLWSELVFVVLPVEHALVARQELTWKDLAEESFIVCQAAPGQEIHDHLVRCIGRLGRHPNIEVQHIGRDNLLALVTLGRGLTLVSEAMTVAQLPGITYRPISTEVLPFNAVWSPRNENPAFQRFLSTARTLARSPAWTINRRTYEEGERTLSNGPRRE